MARSADFNPPTARAAEGSRTLAEPSWANFTPREVVLALIGAATMEVALATVLVAYGSNDLRVRAVEPPKAVEVPIAVQPVVDDLPLLKLGGRKMKSKLPDMWKKNPPVQRFEEASAPSEKAADSPEAIPTSHLVAADASAPPPDAEVAKEVDQVLLDAGPQDAGAMVSGEGSPDGVKEGTETDPLKARVVSQYLGKIMGWFNNRFVQPAVACPELAGLSASVAVQIGQDRTIASYTVVRASGNAVFDAQVTKTMSSAIGQELPPPPPLYPDILGQTVHPRFQGRCP